jgi:hypothetical protein
MRRYVPRTYTPPQSTTAAANGGKNDNNNNGGGDGDVDGGSGSVEDGAAAAAALERKQAKLLRVLTRWSKTTYSDVFAAWVHVKALRLFVGKSFLKVI